jgi:hypothetical protein
MKMRYRLAVLFSLTTMVAGAHSVEAGPIMVPNMPYCTGASGGGSPWCGYSSLEQCRQSAAGTGRECISNYWISERTDGESGTLNALAQQRPAHRLRRRH